MTERSQMRNLTPKQKEYLNAVRQAVSDSSSGKVGLLDISKYIPGQPSPTKQVPVLFSLDHKGLVKTRWLGHSFVSIVVSLPKANEIYAVCPHCKRGFYIEKV